MMPLFNFGKFSLSSGGVSNFKIDCDALSDDDIGALAKLAALRLPAYSKVYGVPRGGLRLAQAMDAFTIDDGPVLICDDVLTSGTSMEWSRRYIEEAGAIGLVLFARRHRDDVPKWITPMFCIDEKSWKTWVEFDHAD